MDVPLNNKEERMQQPKEHQVQIEKLLYWHLPIEERIHVLANLILDKLDAIDKEAKQIAEEVTENV
jgi:hypothetical protein